MRRSLITAILLMAATCDHAAAKSAGNQPYVAAFKEQSPFYARCIPDKSQGSQGTTQILRLRPKGDEVIVTYPWFNRHGLVMGWSPKAGKVGVMRVEQDKGMPIEKQIEFSFYLGDQLLRSYTTTDLVQFGAKIERDADAIEAGHNVSSKHAVYRVEGCKQVWNTNDYYFSVRLNETQALSFDILTGNLCRIENGDRQERLVPVEDAAERPRARNQSESPPQRGERTARAIGQRTVQILYYGKPWPQGKPLVDDESVIPVKIAEGCDVTRDFVEETDAYNRVMREGAKAKGRSGNGKAN